MIGSDQTRPHLYQSMIGSDLVWFRPDHICTNHRHLCLVKSRPVRTKKKTSTRRRRRSVLIGYVSHRGRSPLGQTLFHTASLCFVWATFLDSSCVYSPIRSIGEKTARILLMTACPHLWLSSHPYAAVSAATTFVSRIKGPVQSEMWFPFICTVPVKSYDTPTHSRVFLYFLLFSTLYNNSEDIKTMK